jgi:3-hydroxyacyl-[acyl-carrier-protein] dehydratase
MNSMDIHQILEYLPHRYPFLMVDRVVSCVPGKSIVAIKNVTINEPFFGGHFPHHPVMPGVMIIEALAQAAGILSFRTQERKASHQSIYYFVGINNARFKKPVMPGDTLELNVEAVRAARGIAWFSAYARVSEQLVARAELMCTLRAIDNIKSDAAVRKLQE